MINVENIEVFNWEGAIRGMRNPLNSWDKSDSDWEFVEDPSIINPNDEVKFVLGENDLALMRKLVKAGSDHRKFLRQILVSMDITAPLYWWKEFDTYKVGTTANSCSTMHTIHKKPFEVDDFSHERMSATALRVIKRLVNFLELERKCYCESKNREHWDDIIQLLPASYNQKRTVTFNYEVLLNMYRSRKNHKLPEWHALCDCIENLPYFAEICLEK